MNRLLIWLAIFAIAISCKDVKKEEKPTENVIDTTASTSIAPMNNEVMETAVIYEANIRQYSEEGTFNEFTKDIPQLKKLGVKILWIMPIYPISTTKSKGSLGSYYAVSDYTKVNSEFGTIEDFRKLVKTAHENDIYVILDWVANHTGWDHHWIKEHPEYYTKNDKGEIVHTEGTDWTDVADLNYDNMEMRASMRNAMKYWVEQEDVDGFRCDVAGMVPVDFLNKTVEALEAIKPVFMLAEGWEPELMEEAFDMGYDWDTHHKMNAIAQGKATALDWDKRMVEIDSMYAEDDILMNFTSNHDENSWNGTVEERLGPAKELFAALTYVAPGMPLIYSGQEYDMDKRLLFFEKDTIIKTKGVFFPLYEKLGTLKNENPALHGGKKAAKYQDLKTSNDKSVLAFKREKEGQIVLFIGNVSNEPISFKVQETGKYIDYLSQEKLELKPNSTYKLDAWQYMILIAE
ncbi:alpha-amylase family glycosyl hydrolase [Aquimarina brevivitae]|uniref:Maltogenic amylase-like enzyme n=1 Tax=Aquimarina brevivitae TaxID=323412 RepID=A0A4Q7NYN7_9FLAO|nr:alpha-amylase family glycosyl hydrolase [Aquimarina brevivitae]RZS92543.1 maltogenic amylase-like enzyme [Aquimarina brevivitae]